MSMRFPTKLIPRIAVGFFLVIIIISLFFLSRERYFLNKTVRLVCMRMVKFQKLSFKRREAFKFQFFHDSYVIYNFMADKNTWKIQEKHRYPNNITVELENFEVTFRNYELISFKLGKETQLVGSYVILNFFPRQRRSPQKGIIFFKNGEWRALD